MKTIVEWDSVKSAVNQSKHQVSFEEAGTVFDDPFFITVLDVEHSNDEERFITIGLSQRNRVLLLVHTDRNGRIRIISARKATSSERRFYDDPQ